MECIMHGCSKKAILGTFFCKEHQQESFQGSWGYRHRPHYPVAPKQECWEVEEKKAPCQGQETVVKLPYLIHLKIRALTKAMANCEWLGYLLGELKPGEVVISDLFIPEQRAGAGSVDVEGLAPDGTIGTVHSHGSSGKPYASGTDREFVQANHPLCLVTTGGDEYYCHLKVKAACGFWVETEAKIELVCPEELNGFVEEVKTKIQKGGFNAKNTLDYGQYLYPYPF